MGETGHTQQRVQQNDQILKQVNIKSSSGPKWSFGRANTTLFRGAHRALCARCAKSRLFFTTGSHGPQGPEFCTLQPLRVHQGFFVLV